MHVVEIDFRVWIREGRVYQHKYTEFFLKILTHISLNDSLIQLDGPFIHTFLF